MKKGIKTLLTLFSILLILTMTCPAFGQGGEYKSIALNDSGYVLEVHSSTANDNMWYNLGYFTNEYVENGEVTWVKNGRVEHGYTASSSWSRVIVNDKAEVAVFFPGHDTKEKIYVLTGTITCDPNEKVYNGDYSMDKPLYVTWNMSYELTNLYDYMGDSGKTLHAEFSDDGTQVTLRWITDKGFFYTRYPYNELKNGDWANYTPWQVKVDDLSANRYNGIVGYDGDCWYRCNWDCDSDNPPCIESRCPSKNWEPKTLAANLPGLGGTHPLGQIAAVSPNGQYSVLLLAHYTETELAKIAQYMENAKMSGKMGNIVHAIGDVLWIINGLIGDGKSFGYIAKNDNQVKAGHVGSGELPVVAVNNRGWVVTEHTTGSTSSWGLWIICGMINPDGSISWSHSSGL